MSNLLDLDSFPTLPIIVSQVLEHLNNPNSAIKDIATIINKDPAMSTKILKLVNSAFYAFPKRVGTISHAISILGFETVKGLILGVSIVDTFKMKEFDLLNFWEHSIRTAVLSAFVAKRLHYARDDEAFTVGLIHDIGKLVFMLKTPEIYKKIQEEEKLSDEELYIIERRYLPSDHAEIGAKLAREWNFPLTYIEAIEGHHQVEFSDVRSLRFVVFLSNLILNIHEGRSGSGIDLSALEELEISFQDCLSFLGSTKGEIAEFLNIISS